MESGDYLPVKIGRWTLTPDCADGHGNGLRAGRCNAFVCEMKVHRTREALTVDASFPTTFFTTFFSSTTF